MGEKTEEIQVVEETGTIKFVGSNMVIECRTGHQLMHCDFVMYNNKFMINGPIALFFPVVDNARTDKHFRAEFYAQWLKYFNEIHCAYMATKATLKEVDDLWDSLFQKTE